MVLFAEVSVVIYPDLLLGGDLASERDDVGLGTSNVSLHDFENPSERKGEAGKVRDIQDRGE